jgi:hypothetical protein
MKTAPRVLSMLGSAEDMMVYGEGEREKQQKNTSTWRLDDLRIWLEDDYQFWICGCG